MEKKRERRSDSVKEGKRKRKNEKRKESSPMTTEITTLIHHNTQASVTHLQPKSDPKNKPSAPYPPSSSQMQRNDSPSSESRHHRKHHHVHDRREPHTKRPEEQRLRGMEDHGFPEGGVEDVAGAANRTEETGSAERRRTLLSLSLLQIE